MSKAIKFKNNMYLDTRGAVHNGTILKTYLDNLQTVIQNINKPIVDSVLQQNQSYFSTNFNLGEGTYDFELKIVFVDEARNVFVVPNGLWESNKIAYGFVNYGGRMFGNAGSYEGSQNRSSGGMGIANNKNSYWTVFTGTISIRSSQFTMRGQGTSVEGSSSFGLKYEGIMENLTSLSFISADWKNILQGTSLKIWKRNE